MLVFFGTDFLRLFVSPRKETGGKTEQLFAGRFEFFLKDILRNDFFGGGGEGAHSWGERKSCFTDLEASFPHSARQTSHWEFLLEDMLVRWRVPLC